MALPIHLGGTQPPPRTHTPPPPRPPAPGEHKVDDVMLSVHPAGYVVGRSVQVVGDGLRAAGSYASGGADWIDRHAEMVPQFARAPLGVASGLLGFGAGMVEGLGGMVSWTGRMAKGDVKTMQNTANTAVKVAEGAAYVDGQVREGAGKLVSSVGDGIGSERVKAVGSVVQGVGRARQKAASAATRKAVDMVEDAGLHYVARAGNAEGKVLSSIGRTTGIESVQNVGDRMQQGAGAVKGRTRNALVDAVDGAAARRMDEYRRNPEYAVTRDATRLLAEVGSVFVGPEALAGKFGTVARASDVVADSTKLAKGARALTEAAEAVPGATKAVAEVRGTTKAVAEAGTRRAAAEAGEATKAVTPSGKSGAASAPGWTTIEDGGTAVARRREVPSADGGPAWMEVEDLTSGKHGRSRKVDATDGGPEWVEIEGDLFGRPPGEEGPVSGYRFRALSDADGGPAWKEYEVNRKQFKIRDEIPADDGHGPWTEVKRDGRNERYRSYTDADGKHWVERDLDGNRSRLRNGGEEGLMAEARASGPPSMLKMTGPGGAPVDFKIYGQSPRRLGKWEVERIQQALKDVPPAARAHTREIYLSDDIGEFLAPGAVKAPVLGLGGDGVIIMDRSTLRQADGGRHVLYHEMGHNMDTGVGRVSANGPWGKGSSVSKFGETTAAEDLAEVHAEVLARFDELSRLPREAWKSEVAAEKKMVILRHYGVEVNGEGARWIMPQGLAIANHLFNNDEARR